jgi:hypothetical protein
MAKVGGDDPARPAHVGIALIRSLSLRISSHQISKSSFAAYAIVRFMPSWSLFLLLLLLLLQLLELLKLL